MDGMNLPFFAFSLSLVFSVLDTMPSSAEVDHQVYVQSERGADDRATACLVLGSFLLLFGLTSFVIRGRFFASTSVLALGLGG